MVLEYLAILDLYEFLMPTASTKCVTRLLGILIENETCKMWSVSMLGNL